MAIVMNQKTQYCEDGNSSQIDLLISSNSLCETK